MAKRMETIQYTALYYLFHYIVDKDMWGQSCPCSVWTIESGVTLAALAEESLTPKTLRYQYTYAVCTDPYIA